MLKTTLRCILLNTLIAALVAFLQSIFRTFNLDDFLVRFLQVFFWACCIEVFYFIYYYKKQGS